MQVLIDLVTMQILCTCFGKGSENDFAIFKRSKVKIADSSEVLVDKGYQGIGKYVERSFIPYKKPRGGKLSEMQREYNLELSKIRIRIEHVFAHLKKFRILSERYRNRRRRFGLRFNLIASLYNRELEIASP